MSGLFLALFFFHHRTAAAFLPPPPSSLSFKPRGMPSAGWGWSNDARENHVADLAWNFRFKAAWCSVWEVEALPEIFGEVDVVADSLVEMADKIVEAAKSS